jgi:hypothetical protein
MVAQLRAPFALVLLQALCRTDAAYVVYTIFDDDACVKGKAGEEYEEGTCYHFLETYGGWFNPMDEDSIYKIECEGSDVVGVQYHWPQELLHQVLDDGKVTKFSDNAVCNDSLPVGSGLNGAPSGKRVKIKADECIRFEPPRFTPWSYKVRCIQGLDLAPWPDANIIRNQPGDAMHGEMISSECAPCTKKNIAMAGPEERAAVPDGRTFRENCINHISQHTGSMSDGAFNPATSRYKSHEVINYNPQNTADKKHTVRQDQDWCCAPGAAENLDACLKDGEKPPPENKKADPVCNTHLEPWSGDLKTACGQCTPQNWVAEPDMNQFPYNSLYKQNKECFLNELDTGCFNDRASYSYFGNNICCTDGIVGPYGQGKDCFSLDRGLLAIIVAAAFVIIGVPSCFYCYKMSKKVEYKPLP